LVIAILLIVVMLWKVIPTFEDMFKNFGNAELPAPTQIVINISHGFLDYGPLFALGGFGIVSGISYILKNPKSRRIFDRVILKVPVIGPVLKKAAVARFTRTFGTMMASGVPILDALDIVARSAGNKKIEESLMFVRERVSEGKTLVEPLAEMKIFPDMVVQMIGVGEATGAMDIMLNKIADFYEEEVDLAVDGLTALIEPIMMVFIGGVVAGLLLAMYLPIFSLAETIKK
jgi:type IV pilus assembly protein PilC